MQIPPSWPASLRRIWLRYILPVAAATTLLAILGVPALERLLADWFRADVQLRAGLVMDSIRQPLGELLQAGEVERARDYLAQVTGDERLLGVVVCAAAGGRLLQTTLVPASVRCPTPGVPAESEVETRTPSGPIQVSRFALTTGAGNWQVLLVHDLGFIDRRQTTARNFVIAAVLISAVVLALLVGLSVRMLINRWSRLLLGDIRGRRYLDDARSTEEAAPILKRVRDVMREVEARQRMEIEFRENWTPRALQQVVSDHLGDCRIVVVSNREPYIHSRDEAGRTIVQVPASGMVTAIEPIMRACSGTWIAHGSGVADAEVVDKHDRVRVPPDDPSYLLRRVWLTDDEEQGYYYGFSNEGLWPLCHLAYVRPAFRESDWLQYRAVNEKFAHTVAAEVGREQAVILIQDFHFALLPKLIRDRGVNATIALFWHIPWPNAETFGVCPWKKELVLHLLQADILGFHTLYHCHNFLATVDRFVQCQIDRERMTVTLQNHVCHVVPYPISIEWPPRWLAKVAAAPAAQQAVRARFSIGPEVRLGLGVERWDFTKGIIERFHALEALFDRYPAWIGRLSFLQVAAPSRSKLPAYQALQQQTVAEMERINARFGTASWRPIVLIGQHQEPAEVFELYRAADFTLVNSLHDGMNLVAKEYVAARDDEDGVLILSTFTGAARELPEALLINPYDVVETADAMVAALEMPRQERLKRMQLMRRTVAEYNVYRWAGRLLMDVARVRQRQSLESWSGR